MIGGVTRLGGLPGLPGRVTLSAGVTICHDLNVSRWDNPPSERRVHGKKFKSETCMFTTLYIPHKECKMFTFWNVLRCKSTIFRFQNNSV